MTKFYTGRRVRNLFNPHEKSAFKISRSKVELFINCPRCFYLDRRMGLGQVPGYPFTLNSAVDKLLKKEFDYYRLINKRHPIMESAGIDAVPYKNENIDIWRDALRGGIEYLHAPTNFLLSGAIDDLWQGSRGEIYVVDYKSTSKEEEVTLDADWQVSYKRQMEIYQWLLRRNNFNVSSTGYFVYCNGDTRKERFDAQLDFNIKVIGYQGDDSWIEPKIYEMQKCLMSDSLPAYSDDCDYCKYQKGLQEISNQEFFLKKEG